MPPPAMSPQTCIEQALSAFTPHITHLTHPARLSTRSAHRPEIRQPNDRRMHAITLSSLASRAYALMYCHKCTATHVLPLHSVHSPTSSSPLAPCTKMGGQQPRGPRAMRPPTCPLAHLELAHRAIQEDGVAAGQSLRKGNLTGRADVNAIVPCACHKHAHIHSSWFSPPHTPHGEARDDVTPCLGAQLP